MAYIKTLKKINIKNTLPLLGFYIFASLPAYGLKAGETTEPKQTPNPKKSSLHHDSHKELYFKGDRAKKRNNTYTLDGNVEIKQDNTTLNSEKAFLYYTNSDNKTKEPTTILERAVAKGNVRISKNFSDDTPDFHATCDEVEFLPQKSILILTGKPKVWRDDEFIHAKVITINIDTGNISLNDPRGTFASKTMMESGS